MNQLVELALLSLIALAAQHAGRRALELFRVTWSTRLGHIAASVSLGLGMLSYVVLALGLTGTLTLPAVIIAALAWLATLECAASWWRRRSQVACARQGVAETRSVSASDSAATGKNHVAFASGLCRNWIARSIRVDGAAQVLLLTVITLGTLTGALAPPTAGDAMCYHLEIPKRFVQLGAVQFLALTDNSLFPFLMEMLYTLALLVRGAVLAQLLHWLVGLLFAAAVVELATPSLGRAGGRWAGLIALAVPGVTNQMAAPLNDLAVALFATLLVIAWSRWSEVREWRWLVLAAVFGGFGLSVKLVTAAMAAIVLVAIFAQAWRRDGFRTAAATASVFVVCLVVTGGVWYARSWYHLGNPVYPYFNSLFGIAAHTASTLRTPYSLIEFPWAATMHPEAFGGRGVQFGAAFLAILPGLCLMRHGATGGHRLLWPAVAYTLVWFAVRQDLRFLLPVVPMLAIGVVAAQRGLHGVHRPAFVAASAALALVLAFQALIVAKRSRPCLAVAIGRESRDEYLRRHEPTFELARFVNAHLPGARLISQDYRGFYFAADFVREAALRRHASYAERGDALVDSLARQGYTHVLLVESFNPDAAVYEREFEQRLGASVDRLPVIVASRFSSAAGDRRAYRLLELPRDAAQAGSNRESKRVGAAN